MRNTLYILTILLLLPACGGQQDRNLSTEEIEKAFLEAVKTSNLERVKELLISGVNVDVKDEDGMTALQRGLSPTVDNTSSGEIIIFEDREDSPFTFELAKILLAAGSDAKVKDEEGRTLLHWTVLAGEEDFASLLIDNGADVMARTNGGNTPLHWTARDGREEISLLLIGQEADINARNNFGTTPIAYASANGHEKLVHLLVAKGAEINATDSDGEAPLHMAAEEGHNEIVEFLFLNGADVNKVNREHKTSLDLAKAEETKELLRKHGAVSGKELKQGK